MEAADRVRAESRDRPHLRSLSGVKCRLRGSPGTRCRVADGDAEISAAAGPDVSAGHQPRCLDSAEDRRSRQVRTRPRAAGTCAQQLPAAGRHRGLVAAGCEPRSRRRGRGCLGGRQVLASRARKRNDPDLAGSGLRQNLRAFVRGRTSRAHVITQHNDAVGDESRRFSCDSNGDRRNAPAYVPPPFSRGQAGLRRSSIARATRRAARSRRVAGPAYLPD